MSHNHKQGLPNCEGQMSAYNQSSVQKNQSSQTQAKKTQKDLKQVMLGLEKIDSYFSNYFKDCRDYLKSVKPYQFDKDRDTPQLSFQIQQYGIMASQQYKCPYCPKRFSEGRQVGGHVSKVHPGKSITKLKKYKSHRNLLCQVDPKHQCMNKLSQKDKTQRLEENPPRKAKAHSKRNATHRKRAAEQQLFNENE